MDERWPGYFNCQAPSWQDSIEIIVMEYTLVAKATSLQSALRECAKSH